MDDIGIRQHDCKVVLEKLFGDQAFNIISFTIEPLDIQNGHFTNHRLLRIQFQRIDEVRSLTFLVKTAPKPDKTSIGLKSCQQIFEKEKETYSSFIKIAEEELKTNFDFVLKYYGDVTDSAIVLEDPSGNDFRIPKSDNLDKEHILIGLEALAKLHAASIAFEEKQKSVDNTYVLSNHFPKALEETLFSDDVQTVGYKYLKASEKAIYAILERMPESDVVSEEAKRMLNQALADIHNLLNGTEYRRVFTHGDMWANSVTFSYKEEVPISCKLLNFQFSRYAPPAFDVAEWITSVNGDFRKKCYYALLEHYYTSLKNALKTYNIDIKDIISVEEYEITCKIALRCSKILKAFYFTVSGVNDEYFREISKNDEDFHRFYYEDRSQYALNCYNKDSEFRDNITHLVEDMVEDLKNDQLKIEDIYYIIEKDLKNTDFILMEYKMTQFGCYMDNSKLEVNIMQKGKTKVLQYFVKKMPDISSVKEKCLFENSFLKEHGWFRKIVPYFNSFSVNMDAVVPKCYFSRLHDVIAFADFSNQGYVAPYHRFSLSFDKVLLAIKKMANFHSKTILLEHTKKVDKSASVQFYKKFENFFIESIYYMPEKACNTFTNAAKLGILSLIDYFHDSQSKLSKEILKEQVLKIYDNIGDYLKPSKKYLNTTCHGDLSLHNMMFKMERNIPVDCAFVDFQSYRYAPPAHDLMSFLYLSTDREFRKTHIVRVVELYYDELREILKKNGADVAKLLPDYNVFLESCRYYKLFAIAQSAIHFHISMLTEDQLKSFYSVPGLHDKMLFEDRSEYIINMCNTDPVYKEKLRETILDLQEFCGSNSAMKKITVDRKPSKTDQITFAPNVPYLAGRRYSQIGLD